MTGSSFADGHATSSRVVTGGEVLVENGFAAIAGKPVGLVTNHTGLVNGVHLADVLHEASIVELKAIFAPEHGFRGAVEAGAKVRDGIDPKTGVPVLSLYGALKKPSQRMLSNIDVMIFDIQDIGTRYYTYISTMGLAMQAAAKAGIPFLVLDRPNPLGGDYVSGFVLEPKYRSFVGKYPIPIVHGLTVGELASMIKGEKWLAGLENLDLRVIKVKGWKRSMRWPDCGRKWVSTSPNIPTFMSALIYPGIGLIGETQLANEGTGTRTPFMLFGATWLDARRMALRMNALGLPGVRFEAIRYTPRSIPKVAPKPRYKGRRVNGVRVIVTNVDRVKPLEIGIHALCLLIKEARAHHITRLFADKPFFHKIAGTKRLYTMLVRAAPGSSIIGSWHAEVAAFKQKRAAYLLY